VTVNAGDIDLGELEGLPERVEALEVPANETMVEKTLEELDISGMSEMDGAGTISGNSMYITPYDTPYINISSRVSFTISTKSNVKVEIDGIVFEGTNFEGYVDTISLFPIEYDDGDITFGSIKVGEYKGGITTEEQAKTLILTKIFSEAEKDKLKKTNIYTSADKAVVSNVSNIKNAGYVLSDKTLSDLYNNGKLVIDSSVTTIEAPTSAFKGGSLSGGTSATINFDCNVYISLRRKAKAPNFTAIVDGVVLEGSVKTYTGYVSVMQIIAEADMGVIFPNLQTAEYNGGYMPADSVKDIEKIKSDVGDIGTILDSIIAKQEAYIGTNEVSEVVEETEGGEEV
jgi:hypothetical protein